MKRTARMQKYLDFVECGRGSVKFWLKSTCIITLTPVAARHQLMTLHKLYDLYVRSIKLFHRRLAEELDFCWDDDGNKKTDSQLSLDCKVLGLKDFRAEMDSLVGAAHYGNRTAAGYCYPNVLVKEPLVFFLSNPAAQAYFKSLDSLVQSLDRIQTYDEAMAASRAFGSVSSSISSAIQLESTARPALTANSTSEETLEALCWMKLLTDQGGSE